MTVADDHWIFLDDVKIAIRQRENADPPHWTVSFYPTSEDHPSYKGFTCSTGDSDIPRGSLEEVEQWARNRWRAENAIHGIDS